MSARIFTPPWDLYGHAVLAGDIVTGKLVQQSVKRHYDDLTVTDGRWVFSPRHAQFALEFIVAFCRHSKGEWAGQPFVPSGWQIFFVAMVFGWLEKDTNHRRFRTAYLEVARKNGKTTLLSAIGLYMLIADNEAGAEVYAAATKFDQAKLLHAEAEMMVTQSPHLRGALSIFKNKIFIPQTANKFIPIGSDSKTQDGLNVHAALVDELHAHPDGLLWGVLETGTGARRQPLMLAITTAGFNPASFCYEMRQYVINVINGVADNPRFFGMIFSLDDGDDWQDETVWEKANPNLNISVYLDDLRSQAVKAAAMLGERVNFMTKRLNRWCRQANFWLDIGVWDKNPHTIDRAGLAGRMCYAGLDLASRRDMTSLVLVFPPIEPRGEYVVLPFYWLPAEVMAEQEEQTRQSYSAWEQLGYLETTAGAVTDYDFVLQRIRELCIEFDVQQIAVDPYNATQLLNNMIAENLPAIQMTQTKRNLNEGAKELEALVMSKRLNHGGHPILRWNAANVTVKIDELGNILPDKSKSNGKIDGIAAAIMALSRILLEAPEFNIDDAIDSPMRFNYQE